MILLDKRDYGKVFGPLRAVSINRLFANPVVEQTGAGRIFVDRTDAPRTFYILNAYGMSLLFGDRTNAEFNERFRSYALNESRLRECHEWMQVFPNEWTETLAKLFGDALVPAAGNTRERGVVELNSRAHFRFSPEKYRHRPPVDPTGVEIVRTDAAGYRMPGTVVPRYFWDTEDDFLTHGVGFSALIDRQLAATAFSAYRHGHLLEIGIETAAEFQKKGLALQVCSALIDYCLGHGLEPMWSCRFENTASRLLAQKLGFEPTTLTPYYRLSK